MTQEMTTDGLVRLSCDDNHILHIKGSDTYPEIRHTTVRSDMVDNYEEVALTDIPPFTEAEYKAEVERLIALRYSPGDESAIRRKTLSVMLNDAPTRPADEILAEFEEYNTYAEQCKVQAKENLKTKGANDE